MSCREKVIGLQSNFVCVYCGCITCPYIFEEYGICLSCSKEEGICVFCSEEHGIYCKICGKIFCDKKFYYDWEEEDNENVLFGYPDEELCEECEEEREERDKMKIRRAESFSSIQTFQQCRKKYHNRYVKKMKSVQNEAARRGSELHEIIKDNTDIKEVKEEYKPQIEYAQKFKSKGKKKFFNIANPNQKIVEMQEVCMGLKLTENNNLIFCEYGEEGCIFRGVADHVILYYCEKKELEIEKIELLDWKSGSSSGNKKQLEVYSLMLSSAFDIDTDGIKCQFIYLDKEKESKPFCVKNIEETARWIIDSIEEINQEEKFEASENFFCKWCEDKECSFHPENEEKIKSLTKDFTKELL